VPSKGLLLKTYFGKLGLCLLKGLLLENPSINEELVQFLSNGPPKESYILGGIRPVPNYKLSPCW
jgi:hypothetical protein